MIGISIAGFDPSGGAGILADVKTFTSLCIHATSVITALTAQNPSKVFSLQPIATDYIEEQIDSIFDEYGNYINYGKTGMLYSPEIVKSVSKKVKEYNLKVVVDPVMFASAGDTLSKDKLAIALKKYLLPHCIITTPNIKEAEIFSGIAISDVNNAIEASQEIGKYCNVLITGGHLNGTSVLNINNKITLFKDDLINTANTHGSGCCFSAAITSYLIKGYDLKVAIEKANNYVKIAIENGWYGTLKQVI
ncbi:hydroxymethylpyrimidine/phosphomethylpyrimidine kinase [Methanobrevibacter cuticularis]|uniref:Hydroxymethylpyrimidine/phosphomethylpyrimidine kinase n=1 Tax=Methanobrevibacter cuticularis TaxID=47311 RepID=A0A166E0I3_9EURY|nr:bifunctional hydroxymethylpyrimidine kinase/phosphomethylpyrimidine kinase [Methanobrevibacter cuticularis]KZX16145.1 hydroxymethylpyrimidine/phosphomethylpyrimidine kinase [Methanobrevibacter cuticularis]